MAFVEHEYNLDTKTWTNPSGAKGTSYLPSLTFGEKPTLLIILDGTLPHGEGYAVSWSAAIAKDWLKATVPMCRTTEDVRVSGALATVPIDTATERFLNVVDGVAGGVQCWLQITGYDSNHTPCCEITMPILCSPALDPVGAGTIPPISVSEISAEQIQAMIDASIATAQGVGINDIISASGNSLVIQAGKIYDVSPSGDFTFTAESIGNGKYAESVVFLTVNGNETTFDGIDFSGDVSGDGRYRILVSWTPSGKLAEITGKWDSQGVSLRSLNPDVGNLRMMANPLDLGGECENGEVER